MKRKYPKEKFFDVGQRYTLYKIMPTQDSDKAFKEAERLRTKHGWKVRVVGGDASPTIARKPSLYVKKR